MPNLCVKSEILLVECNGSFGVPYNILHYSYENSTVPPMIHVKSLNLLCGRSVYWHMGIYFSWGKEVKKLLSSDSFGHLLGAEKTSSAGMHRPYVFLDKKLLSKKVSVKCLYVCQVSVVSEHHTRVFCSTSDGSGSGRKRNITLILTLEVEKIQRDRPEWNTQDIDMQQGGSPALLPSSRWPSIYLNEGG